MKIALLIGNRYNPWHFQVYGRLPGAPEVTVFRAESEIQRYFDERDDSAADNPFKFERIYFHREKHPLLSRFTRGERIMPFHDRLKRYNLVQTWEMFTDWSDEAITARLAGGPPVVVMVWDNIPFNMESDPRRREIKQRVKQHADLFIVHTELSRQMLRIEGVPGDRIAMVPPAVDTERFSPAAASANQEQFTMLFVGWFLPRKGLPVLLYALRTLLDDPELREMQIRLEIVGSGPGKSNIDALVERLRLRDACRFRGSLPYGQMPDVYRESDCFILPSVPTPEWQEQFGMSLIEAMACGIPSVTTYSGAIPEIAGDAALLCPPGDFVDLGDKLKHLITHPEQRRRLSQQARTRASERYAIDSLAEGLARVYQSM